MSAWAVKGAPCVCIEDEWWNFLGEKNTMVHRTMRLTVLGRRNVNGMVFLSFEETPPDCYFLIAGFKPVVSPKQDAEYFESLLHEAERPAHVN